MNRKKTAGSGKRKKTSVLLSFLLIIFMLGTFVYPILSVKAAGLTIIRDYLNRNQEDQTSGITHEIIFRPATAVSGGSGLNKIILVFPDGDDGEWCRTAGTDLVVATTSLKESATALPGTTKTARCTQGSGGSSYDTIYIEGVDNLVNSTTYGVIVSDGSTGKLGTSDFDSTGLITIKTNNGSTDIDSSTIAVDIIAGDQVTISGQVDATLSFALSADTAIGFGSITSAAVRYATADEAGSASVPGNGAPVQLTASTNADDGVVIEIRDYNSNSASGLYSADTGTTLTSVASTLVSAGSEEFGVYGKNASSLTIDEGFDNDSTSDLAISTTFQTFASTTGPVSSGTVDVTPVAAIAGTTPAGNFADTLTIVATGKF